MVHLKDYRFAQLFQINKELRREPRGNSETRPPFDLVLTVKMGDHAEPLGYLKCQKLLLSIVSPVFKELCYGTLPEEQQQKVLLSRDQVLNIDIIGYSLNTVKQVVFHLHTGVDAQLASLPFKELLDIYQFSLEFELTGLSANVDEKIRSKPVEWSEWENVMDLVLTRQHRPAHLAICKDLGFRCALEVQEHWSTTFHIITFLAEDPDCPKRRYILEILNNCTICPNFDCQYHTLSEMHSKCCSSKSDCGFHMPYSPEVHQSPQNLAKLICEPI